MAGDTKRTNSGLSPTYKPFRAVKHGEADRVPNRYQALVNGDIDIETITLEELLRGQLMDKNGKFTGRPPNVIPKAFHDMMVRELTKRMNAKFAGATEMAINTLMEIAGNPRAPADARFKAATYIVERLMGKVPDKQIVEATIAKWEINLQGLIVDVDEPAGENSVVEAVVVEDLPLALPQRPKMRRRRKPNGGNQDSPTGQSG